MDEMAVWLREPGFFGTHATVGADVSQLMATFFTTLFIVGWIQARKHKTDRHHWLMFGGMIAMLAFFISYYLFRSLGVLAFEGKEGFGGPHWLYDQVFVPVLTLHILLVVIGLVMAIYMMVLGFRSQTFVEGKRVLKDAILKTSGRRIVMILGGVSTVVILFFLSRGMTSGFSMGKFSVYLGLILLIAVVFGIEISIQRIWPNGARRHRVLGRFTMVIYCVLFVTGTFTYTMLYILYPGKIG